MESLSHVSFAYGNDSQMHHFHKKNKQALNIKIFLGGPEVIDRGNYLGQLF